MWNKEYFKQRYEKRLKEATEFLGGCCVECGKQEQLQFDYILGRICRYRIVAIIIGFQPIDASSTLATRFESL